MTPRGGAPGCRRRTRGAACLSSTGARVSNCTARHIATSGGAEIRPIDASRRAGGVHRAGSLRGLANDAGKWIGCLPAALRKVRQIELRIGDKGTATERRLGAELFENELFDGIVEKAEAGAHAGFARAAGEFGQPTVGGVRTPGQTDARSKTLVIGGREAARHARVAGEHQAERK